MSILDLLTGQPPQSGVMRYLSLPQTTPPAQTNQPVGGGRVNPVLDNPAFSNSLTRLGLNMMAASAQPGSTVLGAFGTAGAATLNQMDDLRQKQQQIAILQQEANAKAAKAQQEAQFGVQSQGFEGDMARAMYVLQKPDSTPAEKQQAQAIIQTAQRLQGSWDPVNGQFAWNPKSQLGAQPVAAPMDSSVLPGPIPIAGQQPQPGLLPPPVAGQMPDASMFQPIGNRKVDAALQQQAAEVPLAGRKTVAEGVATADTAVFGALADQTRKLASIEPQVQQIKAIAANTKTGGVGVARMKLGQLFGVDLDGVPEAQQIQAITSALAPAMRAPGSGSSSDRDVNMFLAALPNLWNTPGGIDRIADSYSKLLERRKEEEKIARRLLKDQGSLDGFYDETAKLKPLFDEKSFGGSSSASTTQGASPQSKIWRLNSATGRLE